MDPLKNHLSKIAVKTRELSEAYLRLKKENEELQKAVADANKMLEIQKNRIEYLESSENLTKIATQIVTSPDQHRELKVYVEELIREVDKCIKKLKE